jgi:glycine cleavage system aminomethyltransferase T
MLNDRGGIESDLTITRLSPTAFFAVVPGATLQRDLAWMSKHLCPEEFVVVTDIRHVVFTNSAVSRNKKITDIKQPHTTALLKLPACIFVDHTSTDLRWTHFRQAVG